jgi:hypothetical protein
MSEFDYQKALEKIKHFLQKEHYQKAGNCCGIILEKCLKDFYVEIRDNASEEDLELFDAKEDVIRHKNEDYRHFSLNQLLRLYRDACLNQVAEKLLSKRFQFTRLLDLYQLKKIRNQCAHGECTPNAGEFIFFYYSLTRLLQEMGFISDDSANLFLNDDVVEG